MSKVFVTKDSQLTYVVVVDDVELLHKWKESKDQGEYNQLIAGSGLFTTHKQGVNGTLNAPSKQELENDFGTTDRDAVTKQILEAGQVQATKDTDKHTETNKSKGPLVGGNSTGVHN